MSPVSRTPSEPKAAPAPYVSRLAGTVTRGVPYQNPNLSSASPNRPREAWIVRRTSVSNVVVAAALPAISPAASQSSESQRPGEVTVWANASHRSSMSPANVRSGAEDAGAGPAGATAHWPRAAPGISRRAPTRSQVRRLLST